MEAKQTPTEQEGDTPELRLDQIRIDVDNAYGPDGGVPAAAAGTIQSGAVTGGEAHPGRVAKEPQPTGGQSQSPASSAVIGALPPVEQGNVNPAEHNTAPPQFLPKPEATPPVIGPPTQPTQGSTG